MGKLKGQNLRIMYGESTATIVAAATSCTINVTAQLESSSTKDDTDDWDSQECVGKSWDVSSESLVEVTEGENGAISASTPPVNLIGKKVKVEFGLASGTKNRSVSKMYGGDAIVNSVTVNATNKQNVTYSVKLTGVGPLE